MSSSSAAAFADAEPASLVERVRRRLRAEGIDPTRDRAAATAAVRAEIRRGDDLALARGGSPVGDEEAALRDVLAAVAGLGALQPYLDDPTVEEVWIDAPDRVFAARGGVSERLPLRFTAAEVRDLVERMLHPTGRRVDLSQPFVDASLPDGSRLHVAIPDVARHWTVNLRRFLPAHRTLASLVRLGALTEGAADVLAGAMHERRTVIVSGATHAGNTTCDL